jgi:GPI ethanolamine phosphate transferase 1
MLLFSLKAVLTRYSMLGGSLMVAVGILYLVFEERLLADSSSTVRTTVTGKDRHISRVLIGVQVYRPVSFGNT